MERLELNFMYDATHKAQQVENKEDLNWFIEDLKDFILNYNYVYIGKIGIKKVIRIFPEYSDLFIDFNSKIGYVFVHQNDRFKLELVFFTRKNFTYLGDEIRVELTSDDELKKFLGVLLGISLS
ncbi:hypothetical protein ARV3_gp02 [Acidianus rod-shaped virus 3]|uniref:Uncharacterized protein n=1 Tax=Acidianus rod-shaped virus 3 TaxID=2730617 RepID=A0A6M3VZ08_9VIRU|nr:hypothetical protein QIT28_gp02 [Acidianus rod-shaped virus 3]QJF12315.1 hypothetical protein ARV3_gp02 [Acidianus rod-shaped virus 3]